MYKKQANGTVSKTSKLVCDVCTNVTDRLVIKVVKNSQLMVCPKCNVGIKNVPQVKTN